jgi:hypothetical protein
MRRCGIVGLLLLVVGVPLWITNVGVSAATKNEVSTCSITSLRVTHEGASAGMTQTEQLFWIRNVSAHECSLKGYPMISFIDLAGKSRSPALRDQPGPTYTFYGNARGRGAPLVDLKPHVGLASFWLVGDDTYPPSHCVKSVITRIAVPGSGGSTTVRARSNELFDFCGVVSVDPIVAGLSGSIPARALADVPGLRQGAT